MKKIIAVILSVIMLFGAFSFADAKNYNEAGQALKSLGIITGDEKGSLNENDYLTREQSIVILLRMLGVYEKAASYSVTKMTFKDVSSKSFYAPYVAYAQANGLTSGISKDEFGFNQNVTTKQMLTYMMRALGHQVDWSKDDVMAKATGLGLLKNTGVANKENSSIIRGETFMLMVNALNTNVNGKKVTLSDTLDLKPAAKIRVSALKGPTSMGLAKLATDASTKDQYSLTLVGSPDLVAPAVLKGEQDIICLPANMAAMLYNKTNGNIKLLGINTLNVIYIVENGDSIKNLSDLKGKTIIASGKGATPEAALNYILRENGLTPGKDVKIDWKSEHSECVAALEKNKNAIAMIPQPFVTVAQAKNKDFRIAIDFNTEWDKINKKNGTTGDLITGVVITSKKFADENPEKIKAFLAAYKESVNFVNSNPAEGAKLIESLDILKAPIAQKAIPYCNITLITGDRAQKSMDSYLKILLDFDAKTIGGKLPNENFYFK